MQDGTGARGIQGESTKCAKGTKRAGRLFVYFDGARGRVDGEFTIHWTFDGVKQTRPNGVIHIVTGGGGAKLYSVDFEKTIEQLKKDHPGNWVPLTAKYVADPHSYTVVDLNPERLTLRQISIAGEEIDRVVIDKP